VHSLGSSGGEGASKNFSPRLPSLLGSKFSKACLLGLFLPAHTTSLQ
jgi:hypothetical protein